MVTPVGVDINRGCSPMLYVEENLNESREKLQERKKKLVEAQTVRSPFLIGSIEEVNRRISNLDKKLQNYTELVIESRASQHSDDTFPSYEPQRSSRGREISQKKAKEAKELNTFAGMYSIKSTFLTKPSERLKNISKISMDPSKASTKKDSGKPKFVELHQYPGYDTRKLTPLPNDVSAVEVLTKAASAQPKLGKKAHYKPEFERLFYSPMSQAILQDTFWWLFLDKWQAGNECQPKLFNRVAHNFVKLMLYAQHPQYREAFFRDYAGLLVQSVYAAYCWTFPDSYRLFNEQFKDDLIALVYEWVAGCKPAPRIWMTWNFAKLEPPGLKQREALINQSKAAKKTSSLHLDFLGECAPSQFTGSQSTLNQCDSESSVTSVSPARRHTNAYPRLKARRKSMKSSENGSSSNSEGGVIQEVACAQTTGVGSESSRSSLKHATGRISSRDRLTECKSQQLDSLTPIREFEEEADGVEPKESKVSFMLKQDKSPLRESHPVGKGAEFVKGEFNIHGQSPLVAQFLRMKNLQVDAGMHVRVQRTEMESLPPLDARTYRDVIQDSFRSVREAERNYQGLIERGKRDALKFIQTRKKHLVDHKKKETALLSNRREVKRISDLIMLEQKRDQDSIGAGVQQAIAAALDEAVQ